MNSTLLLGKTVTSCHTEVIECKLLLPHHPSRSHCHYGEVEGLVCVEKWSCSRSVWNTPWGGVGWGEQYSATWKDSYQLSHRGHWVQTALTTLSHSLSSHRIYRHHPNEQAQVCALINPRHFVFSLIDEYTFINQHTLYVNKTLQLLVRHTTFHLLHTMHYVTWYWAF